MKHTAVSMVDIVCSFVPEVLAKGGDVLADLSQADLEDAYLQAGISFSVSEWALEDLRHQTWMAEEREGLPRLLAAARLSRDQLQQQLLEQQQHAEQAAAAHTVEQLRLKAEVRRLRVDKASLHTQAQRQPGLEEQLQATSLANAEAAQAHEEKMRQLERSLSLQSNRLNTLEVETCELRRQLSSLHVTLAEEEVSANQARTDLQSKQHELKGVQQDLASLKQHASALEAVASRHSEDLTTIRLMLQEGTDTAQQTQQEAQDEHKRLQCEVAEQRGRTAELQQALDMQQEALKAQVQEGEQLLAQERTRVAHLEKSLVDANHSHGSTHLQADSVSKRAGRDFLLDRGMLGSSGALTGTSSGIPADYGTAAGSADPSHDAVPAVCASGDHMGMAGDALTPTTQTLREVFKDYASSHAHEDGLTQSPGSTPVRPHNTQSPQDVPEAEEAPACSERAANNKLGVVTQQLLKMVEAAVNPAQGIPHLRSSGVTTDCLLPGDTRAQLATLITDAFLVSVDVFQQEGKFPAAITLMAKVLDVAHWASLPPGKQAELYGRRALLSRAANQPVHAFADWLRAAQLHPSSSAAVEVVNQLGHWGNFASMLHFFKSIQACLRDRGGTCSAGLQDRLHFLMSAGGSIAQVLEKVPSPGLSGEALLADCFPLVCSFPQNQALMCLQARQQLQLGRFPDVVQTVAAFLGGSNEVAPSRWALHLSVHVHWLTGDLDQMVAALSLLLKTECSPLEGSVGYIVPGKSLLAPLLTQLQGLQALWAEVDRSTLTPVMAWCFLEEVDSAEGVLQKVDASCRGLMSPLLRSRQLLLWAQLHYSRARYALNIGQPAVGNVVKALAACERARALDPSCWRQAVRMQACLLSMLGSGGALYELYSGVLTEPDLTAEEMVDYSALQSAADTLPWFCDNWDAMRKPPLNPAQLLGVTFGATPDQVTSARNKLTVCCHPDKACLPGNSFVAELEGVGALMGDSALKAMERLQGAKLTISLVNGACATLTNRIPD
ncbi:hypothetical protein WJX77_011151 [Trebouxia sp. C0004]